jgi:WD40 repeat protein
MAHSRALKIYSSIAFAAVTFAVLGTWRVSSTQSPWNDRPLSQIRTLTLHSGDCPVFPSAMAYSPDSAVLAVGTYRYERTCGVPTERASQLTLWDLATGEAISTLFSDGAIPTRGKGLNDGQQLLGNVVRDLAFDRSGQWAIAGLSDGTVRIWDRQTGQPLPTLDGHETAVQVLELSPRGHLLASGSSDGTIALWDLDGFRNIGTLAGRDTPVRTLRLFRHAARLIAQSVDGTTTLWDINAAKPIRQFQGTGAVEVSPDGLTFAIATAENAIELRHSDRGTRIRTLSGHLEPIRAIAFSPDGTMLASSSEDNTIHLWNVRTGAIVRTLSPVGMTRFHRSPIADGAIAFSPDGTLLAASALMAGEPSNRPQPAVRLWEIKTGRQIETIEARSPFGFSPDGTRFVGVWGQALKVWQVRQVGDMPSVSPLPGSERR